MRTVWNLFKVRKISKFEGSKCEAFKPHDFITKRGSIAQSNNSSLNRICSKHTNIQWMEVELFGGFFLTSRESKELLGISEMSVSILVISTI